MSEFRLRLRQWWMFNGYAVITVSVMISLLMAALCGLLTAIEGQSIPSTEDDVQKLLAEPEQWPEPALPDEDR